MFIGLLRPAADYARRVRLRASWRAFSANSTPSSLRRVAEPEGLASGPAAITTASAGAERVVSVPQSNGRAKPRPVVGPSRPFALRTLTGCGTNPILTR